MEPGIDACPRCARWLPRRQAAWHALKLLAGGATLAALVQDPLLELTALPLLLLWSVGLLVCGGLALTVARCACRRSTAAR